MMNKKFLVLAIIFLFLIISIEGFLYWRMTRISPTSSMKVSPGDYITSQNLNVYDSPNQRTPFGYLVVGRRFTVLEQRGDWLLIENQVGIKAWTKTNETADSIQQSAQGN
jgi:hypothetical protein